MSFVLDGKNAHSCDGFKSSANDEICLSPISVVAGEDRSRSNFIKAINFLVGLFNGGEEDLLCGHLGCTSFLPLGSVLNGNFSLEFEMNGVLYRYVLELERGRIVYESLHQKRAKLYSYLFVREIDQVCFLNEIKIKNFGVTEKCLRHVKANSSLIYAGAMQGSLIAKKMASSFLSMMGGGAVRDLQDVLPGQVLKAADFFYNHDLLRKKMVNFLVHQGFDLCDVKMKRSRHIPRDGNPIFYYVPEIIRSCTRKPDGYSVTPIWLEDRKFMAVFVQLSVLLPALEGGGVVCMDGMDALVDPEILNAHLGMFANFESNVNNAQVILVTKSIDVLGGVHPCQAYIASRVYP
ncbi:hypothetical protein SAMN05660284_02031 [Formivibrio citricus]|uniref:Uncharacterized protein n=1 Tax=Formivibrio citricus TaxID=83765 RepID=A0A1I5AY63_9NEIS|nr:ATP-binding protein [Formivibrio citricus]SFN67367.1 hypothetical protein SAMN05660284_02031 [Formivibrio citricus]